MSEISALDARKQPAGYEPPRSVEELLRRYEHGERYFVGIDLPDGAAMPDVDLQGANLENGWLFDADFRGANLRHVNFTHTNVKCSDFTNADLEGACFQGAPIDAAVFTGANLQGASFAGAGAYGYTFKENEKPETDATVSS